MNKRIILAVLGMPGSGKTEAIKYLIRTQGWPKVYFGDITFEEMARRGLDSTQENERIVREDLRKTFGKDHYARKIIEKIDAIPDASVVLVESFYSWTEYLVFRERYGTQFRMIAIHASPDIRHARLIGRPIRPLSNEEAWQRDKSQIEALEQGGPIAMADHVIVNEGPIAEMERALDALVVLYQ